MNNLPLKALKWDGDMLDTPLHTYQYLKDHDSKGKYMVKYAGKNRSLNEPARGFATIDEAKAWAWNHYNEKMQPYVKPSPTWIDVDDRLPEMYKRVLIKADCYLVAGREPKSERNKDWGITGEWMWAIVSDNWCDAHMVTHWMPIPEFSTMQNNKGE